MHKRFNIPGFFALIITALTFFVAVFVYYLAPDSSPYANEMHLELSLLEPQTEVTFIKLRNDNTKDVSFFYRLIYGEKMNYRPVPVNTFTLNENELEYEPYNSSYIKKLKFSELEGDAPDVYSYVRVYHLGTDKYGRDLLSRLMVATRISLAVGFISVFISLVIGITLGLISGYYGSWVDKIIMWLINVVWSIPTLLMVIAISLALGKGFWQVFVAVGLTMWVEVARVVRGQVISLKKWNIYKLLKFWVLEISESCLHIFYQI